MNIKVTKFGGSSLANREQIEKALNIVKSNKERKYMVVSAPGARYEDDTKVTDLLLKGKTQEAKRRYMDLLPKNHGRAYELLESFESDIKKYGEACGEKTIAPFCAEIAREMGIKAIACDPWDVDFIVNRTGNRVTIENERYTQIGKKLNNYLAEAELVIFPGFFGYDKTGKPIVFPRGFSDNSGSFLARAVNASVYENFTDIDGLTKAHPEIVPQAKTINEMTYDEARELAYMGFKLQDTCFEPIKGHGIVLNVRNTNNPSHPGTRISDTREIDPDERIVGVASDKNCFLISMRKMNSDQEVGLGRKLFQVLEENEIPYEHHPTGVDSLSVILREKYFSKNGKLDKVLEEIKKNCTIDRITTSELALISVAGLGIKKHYDTHARIFSALAKKKIPILTTDEGADDLSIAIGIERTRVNDAVRAVYYEFYPGSLIDRTKRFFKEDNNEKALERRKNRKLSMELGI
jgi:aspartate kinase